MDLQGQNIATGVSVKEDAWAAAAELTQSFGDLSAEFILFFASTRYDIEKVGLALSEYNKGVPVIGCTTAGEINPLGCLKNSLCGFTLPKSSFRVVSTSLTELDQLDLKQTQKQIADLFSELSEQALAPVTDHTFAFLLVDGLCGLEEVVLSAVQGEIGDIPFFGGSAGDDLKFCHTQIFHNGKAQENTAVLCLINTICPFTVFRTQHFVASELKMVITQADVMKRNVSEINGVSAGKEYARLVGIEYDRLDPMTFASHPVMVRVGGSYYVRSIQQLSEDDSLTFFCAIDEGIVLTVAEGVDLVENLSQSFTDICNKVGRPQLIIGCDCIFRRLEYAKNPNIANQVEALFKSNHVVGFNTYGEQFAGMHVNQTFTGVAIGSPSSWKN